MCESTDRRDCVLAFLEEANLVRDARVSELVDSQAKINDLGEGERCKVVAVRGNNESDGLAAVRIVRDEAAVLDEIGVYNGINSSYVSAVLSRSEKGGWSAYKKL